MLGQEAMLFDKWSLKIPNWVDFTNQTIITSTLTTLTYMFVFGTAYESVFGFQTLSENLKWSSWESGLAQTYRVGQQLKDKE